MYSVEGVEAQALEYQKIEEVFEDKDSEFFNTLLSFGSVNQLKSKLKLLKDQGTDIHGVCRSYFQFFYPKKTLGFLEFLEWCCSNYSSSKRVIMDADKTKIFCPLNPFII